MKNFKKLMALAVMSMTAQQAIFAYDKNADDAEPKHQGWGRLWGSTKQIVTLHPVEGLENLGTGDQADTTFGWHKNEEGHMQANYARTERNENREEDRIARQEKQQNNKKKQEQKRKQNKKQKNQKNKQQEKQAKAQKNKKTKKSDQ